MIQVFSGTVAQVLPASGGGVAWWAQVMREFKTAMDGVKEQVNTEYERTEKETKNEVTKLPIEGKITEDKTEAEDKRKV